MLNAIPLLKKYRIAAKLYIRIITFAKKYPSFFDELPKDLSHSAYWGLYELLRSEAKLNLHIAKKTTHEDQYHETRADAMGWIGHIIFPLSIIIELEDSKTDNIPKEDIQEASDILKEITMYYRGFGIVIEE